MFSLNPQLAASLCFNMFFVASFFMPEKISKILYSLLWLIVVPRWATRKFHQSVNVFFGSLVIGFFSFFFDVLLLLAGVEATAFL